MNIKIYIINGIDITQNVAHNITAPVIVNRNNGLHMKQPSINNIIPDTIIINFFVFKVFRILEQSSDSSLPSSKK